MKEFGLNLFSLVGINFIFGVLSQEQIFVGSRLDGSVIGPYKVRPLDRFYDRNDSDKLSVNVHDVFSSRSFEDSNPGIAVTDLNNPIENTKSIFSFEINELKVSSQVQSKNTVNGNDFRAIGVLNKSDVESVLRSPYTMTNIYNISNDFPGSNEKNLTVQPITNDSASNFVISRGNEDENMSEESIEFEIFTLLINHDADDHDYAIKADQNSSKIQNNTLEISTEATDSLDDVPLTPSASCHATCSTQLEEMIFKYSPKKSLIQSGNSLALECSIPFEYESAVRIVWLFQRIIPPSPQCSLTPQETLNLCSNFAAVEHTIDTNLTSKIASEKVFLSSLTSEDSGYYFCLVELTCCSPDPHIMQLIKKTETPIDIYEENYVLELSVLGGLVGCLLVLLIIGTYLQKKRRRRSYFSPSKITAQPGVKDVLHAPILDPQGDSDSFDESGDEA